MEVTDFVDIMSILGIEHQPCFQSVNQDRES